MQTEQMTLSFDREQGIQAKFMEFHRDNPHVYQLILKYVDMVRRTGRTHYSMKGIFERVRWHHDIETNTREPFKLNNNYTARYVRLIEKEYPNLVGFFRTRELTSD